MGSSWRPVQAQWSGSAASTWCAVPALGVSARAVPAQGDCIGTGWGGLGRAWGRPTRASTVGHKSSDLAALLYVTNQMGVQVFCVGQQWGNQVGVPRHPCSSELKASVPAGGDGPWAVLGYTFLPGFPARRAAVDLTPQRLPLTAAAVSPPELSGTSVTPLCGHVTGVIPRLGGHKEP